MSPTNRLVVYGSYCCVDVACKVAHKLDVLLCDPGSACTLPSLDLNQMKGFISVYMHYLDLILISSLRLNHNQMKMVGV